MPDSPAQEDQRVKNGWLVIALVACFAVMVLLIILDLRLLRDPSVAGKLFGSAQKEVSSNRNSVHKTDPPSNEPQGCKLTPEVTFYTKLSSQTDPVSQFEPETGDAELEKDSGIPVMQTRGIAGEKEGLAGSASRPRVTGSAEQSTLVERTLPEPGKGLPLYTVQVGAFAHPGIAQEWAAKWRARGYDVVLKPVARPKTGVIYRLYLGSFESEKTAEDLVRHLKSKEGISAFTLVLRN